MDNVFDEFQWRGLVYDATEGLKEHFAREKVSAYIGFDPSAAIVSSTQPLVTVITNSFVNSPDLAGGILFNQVTQS